MLLLDGKRIGCAFVQYSSVFDASRAIKKMNGEKIQGVYNVYIIITYIWLLPTYVYKVLAKTFDTGTDRHFV